MSQVGTAAARLRLLFVVPFPPRRDATHGGRVVAQLLSRLAKRHDVALVYLTTADSPPVNPELADSCDVVQGVEVRRRNAAERRWRHRLSVLATPLTGMPAAAAAVSHRSLADASSRLAAEWRPDVVQVEHDLIAYCGPALRRSGSAAVRVLTCHEPGLLASRDQARMTRGRQRLSHRLDAASWKRYWSRTLPAFDAVVTFTDSDREAIREVASGPRFVSIGFGMEIGDALSATGTGDPSVLYIGGYQHPPNGDAAMRLLHSIMPAVRGRLPGMRLLLVGTDPSRQMLEAAGPDDIVTGAVQSVEPYVDAASLLVLPIRLGGGMRVKLLEGLAAGKAIVASPLAAAGLDGLTDGEQIVLAESDEEFTEAIVRLASDDRARAAMGERARRWAEGNLAWEPRVRAYEELYHSLLARPAP